MGVMTVRELNANVSQALARAQGGEILSITRNGKPVAELRPVRDAAWHAARSRLEELWQERWGTVDGKVTDDDKHGDVVL